ncbi:septal ring lytic transglycosylase RlpA family protein [Candidatus Puniceispirillum sp.]|uniref:septal ring lytic transglycosylase RlpA family protein n=1 Tax=Candidatus Puniceispirillum sp. TaxID=2026719 RepID=UPI003F69E560
MIMFRFLFVVLLGAFLLQGCTTAELAVDLFKKSKKSNTAQQSDSDGVNWKVGKATKDGIGAGGVKAAPRYKIGNPYQVAGIWYYPDRDLAYDETGIGSWYGDEFAGKLTANGEIFDPERITAAHKTLPMPSVVRVTNLDNGKSLVVRINDRGPFVAGRIIDLSRASARLIGYKDNGLARVRVQVLAEQSLRLEQLAKAGKFPELSGLAQAMPETDAVVQPKVSLTTRSNSKKAKPADVVPQSAIELLANARVGEVIEVAPITTNIWVQIGAFHAKSNASNVLAKVSSIGDGEVSSVDKAGQTLYRVRLGPIGEVKTADKLLDSVVNMGFTGARIIVD